MPRLGRLLLAAVCAVAVAACSGIEGIDAGSSGPSLSASETSAVRGQVDRAVAARRWKVAWNQEIAAGADRERLEAIAVAALGDRSSHAGDMLRALRARWGDLGATGRGQVDQWVSQAQADGRWSRALTLELLAADDPPTFTRAWAVYQAAPPEFAPDLLDDIQDARSEHEESAGTDAGR